MKSIAMHLIAILFPCLLVAESPQSQVDARPEPNRLSIRELLKQLDAKVKRAAGHGEFSGVVLLARNAQTLFLQATGFADRANKTLNTAETRFNLGSMNKMFTSVAIAQLVEKGKLRYADTLATVLPEYPNADAAKKITIEHLLTHASGLPDLFTPEFLRDRRKLRTLQDYLAYFASKPLQFEPGSKRSYSNAGFVVAGLIVEKTSGENFFRTFAIISSSPRE